MTLMDFGEKKLAREYIRYRLKHEEIRAQKKVLIDSEKMVDDYLDKSDWQVKENSQHGLFPSRTQQLHYFRSYKKFLASESIR
jgi:anaerobic ribonucleoside-triphosphate reductase